MKTIKLSNNKSLYTNVEGMTKEYFNEVLGLFKETSNIVVIRYEIKYYFTINGVWFELVQDMNYYVLKHIFERKDVEIEKPIVVVPKSEGDFKKKLKEKGC